MELTPGLRAAGVPAASDALAESDPELLTHIRDEIARRGPITFARFMELALYEPGLGYYRRTGAGPGPGGDYLTAPEMHPLFGETLGLVVVDAWRRSGRPEAFAIVEYGAGSGALASSILSGVVRDEPDALEALRYVPVEIDERRAASLRERLISAGFATAVSDGSAMEIGGRSSPMPGIAIANEYLDALPTHVVEAHDGALVELFVGMDVDGTLGFSPGPLSDDALADRLRDEGIDLADGQRAEICLAIDGWAEDVSTRFTRGSVLVIDYGAEVTDLYDPSRRRGTLMAYAGHRAHDDPFVAVGRQDLTAHVDMTAVERSLGARGWHTISVTSQAEFLVAAGMESTLARLRVAARDLEGQLALRSAAGRLLDPRATGGFRALTASFESSASGYR